jgi:hypothetical protein
MPKAKSHSKGKNDNVEKADVGMCDKIEYIQNLLWHCISIPSASQVG